MDNRKTYLLDTNILIHAPYALLSFDEHNVSLVDITLEELDKLKSKQGEVGANAREAIRILEKLRSKGNVAEGVNMDGGGVFRVETNHQNVELPSTWDVNSPDNRIIRVCKGLRDEGKAPILVTNDTMLRIKADIINVPAEEFKTDRVASEEKQYKGRKILFCSSESLNEFYRSGTMPLDELSEWDEEQQENAAPNLSLHEFCVLQSPSGSGLGCFNGDKIEKLHFSDCRPYGVSPKNAGQRFAVEALMASSEVAPLVILKGAAGTGKTFLALAAALSETLESADYRKILVCRPNVKFDEDIGFLKGTEEDKIAPLIRPIMDNFETLTASKGKYDEPSNYANMLFENGTISAQAMAYMRGRSISNTYIIIDEAQNMSPTQAFGIISRVGNGSKVVLLGDPSQIDAPYLDSRNNGLSFASERMKGSPLCWQLTFEESECVRSPLALDAIKRLNPKSI